MHIAFVNQWYPPDSHGGVARHNFNLARELVKLGHQVTVICAEADSVETDFDHAGVQVIRIASVNLYRYRRLPFIGRQYRAIQALFYSWRACQKLAQINQEQIVDIAEFAEVNAEGFFWRRAMSKRMVVRCHTPSYILAQYYTPTEMPYATNLLGWFERRVIRRADLVTAPSQDLTDVISTTCQLAPETIQPIPNAVNLPEIIQRPTQSDAKISILHVGRMERAKGIHALVESIPAVCESIPDAQFIFIGGDRQQADGSSTQAYMKQKLVAYIDNKQVQVLGSVSDTNLAYHYKNADMAIVPSVLYESFSYTCAQAMAYGLPVIASAIGGIPETLNFGEVGILVEAGNSQQLADEIMTLCQNAEQRLNLGQQARNYVQQHFATAIVAEDYANLYQATLR